LEETISSQDAIFGPSPFVDLVHRVQLDITGADISFSSPLSFKSVITAGELNVKDMYKLYRYENLLYEIELSGKEIKDYLEYSYHGWFNQMISPDDHLLLFKRDTAGNIVYSERTETPELETRYYNFDSAAGIEYVVNVSKPFGSRIEIKKFTDGRPFVMNENYKVALNSYRGSGGGGHLTEGLKFDQELLSNRLLNSSEKDIRFHIMKWIEERGKIEPESLGNWRVEPAAWYRIAKDRDYRLLYGKTP
jgi:2',3'-cyclic-nucleotide 2'-phosphodiesterase/3'-nucleotidase